MSLVCVCYDGDLERTIEIPAVTIPAGTCCLAHTEHSHLCYRPAGHSGRHADLIHEDAVAFVTAVWDA